MCKIYEERGGEAGQRGEMTQTINKRKRVFKN
jgi:hypothetical protein